MDISNLKILLRNSLSSIDSLSSENDILVLERSANFFGTKSYYLSSEYTRTGSDFPFVADSYNEGSLIAFRGDSTGAENELYSSDGSSWNLVMNFNDSSNHVWLTDSLFDVTIALDVTQNKASKLTSGSHPFNISDIFNMAERQSSGLIHTIAVSQESQLEALDSNIGIIYDTVSSSLILRDANTNTWKVIQ